MTQEWFLIQLELILVLTELPQKGGVCRLKIDRGILGEARMLKHTYKSYRNVIKV
jgi:hypothetical protein